MLKRLFKPSDNRAFRTRSVDRDLATDVAAVLAIAKAIDTAIDASQAEHAGLKRRLDDVILRASIVGGNEIEEHQTRSTSRTAMLHSSDQDIRYGEQRLVEIQNNIAHFGQLRIELQTRFPTIALAPTGHSEHAQ